MRSRQKISEAGVELIERFEGLRRQAARLPDGRWTIGYGHTQSARAGAEVSAEDARALLMWDLIPVVEAVNDLVFTPLNENQFDALAAFAFNVGVDAFRASEVLKAINEGRLTEAACAIDLWRRAEIHGDPLVLDGLIRRRSAEKALFLTPPGGFVPTPSPLIRPTIDVARAGEALSSAPVEIEAPLTGPDAQVRRMNPAPLAAPAAASDPGPQEAIAQGAAPQSPTAEPPQPPASEGPYFAALSYFAPPEEGAAAAPAVPAALAALGAGAISGGALSEIDPGPRPETPAPDPDARPPGHPAEPPPAMTSDIDSAGGPESAHEALPAFTPDRTAPVEAPPETPAAEPPAASGDAGTNSGADATTAVPERSSTMRLYGPMGAVGLGASPAMPVAEATSPGETEPADAGLERADAQGVEAAGRPAQQAAPQPVPLPTTVQPATTFGPPSVPEPSVMADIAAASTVTAGARPPVMELVLTPPPDDWDPEPRQTQVQSQAMETEDLGAPLFDQAWAGGQPTRVIRHEAPMQAAEPRSGGGLFILLGVTGLTAFAGAVAAFLKGRAGGPGEMTWAAWVLALIGVACVATSVYFLLKRFSGEDD